MNSTDLESWCDFAVCVPQTLRTRARVGAESFGSLTVPQMKALQRKVPLLMTVMDSVPWCLYDITVYSPSS